MSNCARKDCHREATHHPVVMVPAMGYPPEPHNCVESIIGLQLCEEHAASPDHAQGIPRKVQLQLNMELNRAGKCCVDWKRAFVEARPIGGEAWMAMLSCRARTNGGSAPQ